MVRSKCNKKGGLKFYDRQITTKSEVLGTYITQLRFKDLSPEVIKKAKYSLIDTIGATLYGSMTEEAILVRKGISNFTKGGDIGIWGTNEVTSVQLAALANGTAAHARELDDVGKNSGHPGAVVIPAALAVAKAIGASGKRTLSAIIVGYEVAERVAESVGGYRAHTKMGWHSTGTCCTFGAAAASAYLMGLSTSETVSALGIVGSYTGGIWAFNEDGAMTKRLHSGKAAENGVTAAYLAKQGFTGPKAIFEAEWGGFCNTYTARNDEGGNLDALVKDLGINFRIMSTSFKPHACCRGIHGALDSLLKLVNQHGLSKGDIDNIDVITSPHASKQLGKKTVTSFLDAQMSMPYSIAVALVSGKTGPKQYTKEWWENEEVRYWCNRVHVQGNEKFSYVTRTPPIVRIKLKNGKTYEGSEQYPIGSPENPMTNEELVKKFNDLVSVIFPQQKVKALLENLFSIEEFHTIDPVLQQLNNEHI